MRLGETAVGLITELDTPSSKGASVKEAQAWMEEHLRNPTVRLFLSPLPHLQASKVLGRWDLRTSQLSGCVFHCGGCDSAAALLRYGSPALARLLPHDALLTLQVFQINL